MNYTEEILLSTACLQDVSLTWFSSHSLAGIVVLYISKHSLSSVYLSDNLNFRGSQILQLSAPSSWEPAEGS